MEYFKLIFGALMAAFISWAWSFLFSFAIKPYLNAKKLRKQGVRGPKNSILSGNEEEIKLLKMESKDLVLDINSNDYLGRVLPHYVKWSSQYGNVFLHFSGQKPWLCISEPELVKQILSNKFGFYTKVDVGPGFMALLGKGLVLLEGEQWARHRRVLNPAFTIDRLKKMTRTMAECAKSMLDQWVEKEEIDVGSQFHELTADIISHTAFGSSYVAGKEVFLAQQELQKIIVLASFSVVDQLPFSKYLPTEINKRRRELEKKLRGTLMSVLKKRLDSRETEHGHDLLGVMMEAHMKGEKETQKLSMDEIIDECKTFFFAGHETTSHLLTWTLFLLSRHLEWQQRLREEVLDVCGKQIPDSDKLSKLKLMTMVLFETLRLYPPVIITARTARTDIKLGRLMIPEGMEMTIPIAMIHHSKEFWGPDSLEFNPLRFQNGVSKAANHPNAMLAFSMGPRACIGQNFVLLEAKTALSMILQRFSFELSPEYKHMPVSLITLQPQKGVQIVLKKLGE